MLNAERQRHHVTMLRVVRDLVQDGVIGYAEEGDDVETIHGRFVRKDTPRLPSAEFKDSAKLYARDAEVKVIEAILARQIAMLQEHGVEVPADN